MAMEFLCTTCGAWQVGELECANCRSQMPRRAQRRERVAAPARTVAPRRGAAPGRFGSGAAPAGLAPAGLAPAGSPQSAAQPPGPSALATGLATLLGAQPANQAAAIIATPVAQPQPPPAAATPAAATPAAATPAAATPAAATPAAAPGTLSREDRSRQNAETTALLTDLGHLPRTRPPLPPATPLVKPNWQVQPGTGIVPPGASAAETQARTEFQALFDSTATVLTTLRSVSTAESNRLMNAGIHTWNLTNTTYVEKLAKMRDASREVTTTLQTEQRCKSEFATIYARCNDDLLPQLNALNPDERDRLRNVAIDVTNLANTGFEEKLRQVEIARDLIQQAIDEANAAIPVRRAACAAAASEVTAWTPQDIAQLGTRKLTETMARLTCVPKAEQPADALAKLYRSMRPDPDFVEDDRKRRDDVLKNLVHLDTGGVDAALANARREWGAENKLSQSFDGGAKQRAAMADFQQLQCRALGITAAPIRFVRLEDGNGGNCSGNQVTVSTNPADNRTFDETLNTVAHETTHAYQHDLTDKLAGGRLPTDDPRYAQAMLFMLNNKAYQAAPGDAPVAPGPLTGADAANPGKQAEYVSDVAAYERALEQHRLNYLAYKKQPVELHAWQAGDEAGRAFDVSALRVNLAGRLQDVVAQLGSNTAAIAEANALRAKLSQITSVPESIDLMQQLEKLTA